MDNPTSKLPLSVWYIESPEHSAADLTRLLAALVANHRVVTARELISALGGDSALPDVAG